MKRRLGKIIWSPAAQRDLRLIWHRLAQVASSEVADNVLDEIQLATERVRRTPEIRRLRLDIMSIKGGLRSVAVHPYTIFYRIGGEKEVDDIEVVRVLHERRDFPDLLRDH